MTIFYMIITQCQCRSRWTKDQIISSHRPSTVWTWTSSRPSHSGSGEFAQLIFLMKGPGNHGPEPAPVDSIRIRENTVSYILPYHHFNTLATMKSWWGSITSQHWQGSGQLELLELFVRVVDKCLPQPLKQRCRVAPAKLSLFLLLYSRTMIR